MIQGSEDLFIRTTGGLYVAWSLDVPSMWGEWALVEVVLSHSGSRKNRLSTTRIIPYRAMCREEVQALRQRPLLFWGMKVTNAPWALVLCRQVTYSQAEMTADSGRSHPNRAIGV
jgi:hypothetical protein